MLRPCLRYLVPFPLPHVTFDPSPNLSAFSRIPEGATKHVLRLRSPSWGRRREPEDREGSPTLKSWKFFSGPLHALSPMLFFYLAESYRQLLSFFERKRMMQVLFDMSLQLWSRLSMVPSFMHNQLHILHTWIDKR